MKKITLLASLALTALLTAPAHSATASNTFNVGVTLTPVCKISTITDIAFTYTSFQTGASTATGGAFTLQCTQGLSHSMGLVLGTTVAAGATTITTTDSAVNLAYTLSTPSVVAATGAALNYKIGGTMGLGQAGTCAGPAACTNSGATNKQYTLVITY